LELLKVENVTTEFGKKIDLEIEAVDKESAQKYKARRPIMNFHLLGIPNGSILVSEDGKHLAVVVEERKVKFDDVVCSLTAATRTVLGLPDDYPIQPSPHWTFNGKKVIDIYEEFHSEEEEE
jgi:hypothetical protein